MAGQIDWWAETAGEPAATAAPSQPAPQTAKTDWWNEVGQAELRAATPDAARRLSSDRSRLVESQVVDDPNRSAGFGATIAAGMSPDPNKQIAIYAKARGIPESRYGIIGGEIVYQGDDGKLVREVPSVSGATGPLDALRRTGQFVGSQIGPSIPAVTGGAAGLAGGSSLIGAPLAAAGGAAVGDMARQAIGNALADRPLGDIDLMNAGGQAAMAGVGQLGGSLLSRAFNRNPMNVSAYDRTAALDPARRQAISDLEAEAQRRGVQLSAGQATDLRSLKAQERALGRFPETADMMDAFGRRQRGDQVPAAVRAEIGAIAPDRGPEAGIQAFRGGADEVVNRALNQRSAQAQVAYGRALDARPVDYTHPALDNAGFEALMRRPSMREAWGQAQRLAAEEGRPLQNLIRVDADGNITGFERVPDWRAWDYMKRGLDAVVEANTNELGRVNAAGRAVANTRREMLAALDRVNPDYAAARGQYGSASDTVNMILDGGAGFLRNMQGPDRQAMVDRVFSGTNLTAEEIGRMRGQFQMAGRLDDWNQGVATWLRSNLSDALRLNAGGEPGGVPGKFVKSVWGDDERRAMLTAALGEPARVRSWERLMEVLQAASRSLPEGSPTATDLRAMTEMEAPGRGLRLLGKLTSPNTAMNIGTELVDGIAALRAPENRIRLAETLLSPDAAGRLNQLRMLRPNSDRALRIAAELLGAAGLRGAASPLTGPDDFLPPDAARGAAGGGR